MKTGSLIRRLINISLNSPSELSRDRIRSNFLAMFISHLTLLLAIDINSSQYLWRLSLAFTRRYLASLGSNEYDLRLTQSSISG